MKITKIEYIKDINKFTGVCEYADGTKSWHKNGNYHREDGPAIEYADGTKSWFLNNIKYTREAYYKELYRLGKISEEEIFLEVL